MFPERLVVSNQTLGHCPIASGVNFAPDHVSCVTKRRVVHCKREPYDDVHRSPVEVGQSVRDRSGRDARTGNRKCDGSVTSRRDLMAALPELHGKVLPDAGVPLRHATATCSLSFANAMADQWGT